jgi:hypothetical protein
VRQGGGWAKARTDPSSGKLAAGHRNQYPRGAIRHWASPLRELRAPSKKFAPATCLSVSHGSGPHGPSLRLKSRVETGGSHAAIAGHGGHSGGISCCRGTGPAVSCRGGLRRPAAGPWTRALTVSHPMSQHVGQGQRPTELETCMQPGCVGRMVWDPRGGQDRTGKPCFPSPPLPSPPLAASSLP